jgi:23S rRNA pseudouridine2605 synthase
MEPVRIGKALAQAGVTSRRKSKDLLLNGDITVNGSIITDLSHKIHWKKDTVCCQGKKIKPPKEFSYLLFFKPIGAHCSHHPSLQRKSIYSFLPQIPGLFSVGRLDSNSSGLLILTNDGTFCQKIIHPSNEIEKEYFCELEEEVTNEMIQKINRGVWIEGRKIFPKKVSKIAKHLLSIVIMEGKKHEIRLMIARKKYHLVSLKRVRIGSQHLGRLKPGQHRPLTGHEVKKLLESSKRNSPVKKPHFVLN